MPITLTTIQPDMLAVHSRHNLELDGKIAVPRLFVGARPLGSAATPALRPLCHSCGLEIEHISRREFPSDNGKDGSWSNDADGASTACRLRQ